MTYQHPVEQSHQVDRLPEHLYQDDRVRQHPGRTPRALPRRIHQRLQNVMRVAINIPPATSVERRLQQNSEPPDPQTEATESRPKKRGLLRLLCATNQTKPYLSKIQSHQNIQNILPENGTTTVLRQKSSGERAVSLLNAPTNRTAW